MQLVTDHEGIKGVNPHTQRHKGGNKITEAKIYYYDRYQKLCSLLTVQVTPCSNILIFIAHAGNINKSPAMQCNGKF